MKKIGNSLIIICLGLALTLTGCSDNKTQEKADELEKKVKSEMSYLNIELIDLMNKLNNINFANYKIEAQEVSPNKEENSGSGSSENTKNEEESKGENQSDSSSSQNGNGSGGASNSKISTTEMVKQPIISANYDDIHWTELEASIETFSNVWNTIILDLYKLNINGNDITEFSTQLDNLVIEIKNKDKLASLNSSAILYSYIPKYIEAYDKNSTDKDIINTKLHILNAYVGATNDNWDYVYSEIGIAEQTFSNIMNNDEISKSKEYNVNKSYVALKELQNSIKSNNKTIFYIKYKNLMQEIEILI